MYKVMCSPILRNVRVLLAWGNRFLVQEISLIRLRPRMAANEKKFENHSRILRLRSSNFRIEICGAPERISGLGQAVGLWQGPRGPPSRDRVPCERTLALPNGA